MGDAEAAAAAMESEQINGLSMEEQQQSSTTSVRLLDLKEETTLYTLVHRIFTEILSPDPKTTDAETESLLRRSKKSVCKNAPLLPEASRNSIKDLMTWTRQGSSLRALLVISVGTIVLLALSGLLVFMLFFLAATVNAVIISLLMSLAAAGGFLALFFACMTAIYISALSVAVFVISCATVTTIFAVLVATGWIGFFWTVWIATKKGAGLAKHSITVTGSALSAYSAARHSGHNEPDKYSD